MAKFSSEKGLYLAVSIALLALILRSSLFPPTPCVGSVCALDARSLKIVVERDGVTFQVSDEIDYTLAS
jgi:hypothetical protein